MPWSNEIRADRETIENFVAAFNAGLIRLEIKIIDDNERSLVRDFSMISPWRFEIEAQPRDRHSNESWLNIDRRLAK